MNRSIALGAVVISSLVTRAVHADVPSARATPAYVLSIGTDEADDQADALTQALRSRVTQTPGWSLLETSQSFETLAIALRCPSRPDPPCLLRIADHLKADRYLWGSVQKKPGSSEVIAEVHLWTRGKPDTLVRETYSESLKDPNSEGLRAIAANVLSTLSSTPLPGARAPTQPPSEEPGFRAGENPGEATEAPSASESRFTVRGVIAYSALVVGGGLLVASGIEAANWIADSDASNNDRKSVPKDVTDVCASPVSPAAIDACAKSRDASNVSALGWIFAGVGAALVGTGTVLLVTGGAQHEASNTAPRSGSRGAKLEVLPAIGARAGHLDLKLTF
jgi:hypothetical protein